MYTYCINNPIAFTDDSGYLPNLEIFPVPFEGVITDNPLAKWKRQGVEYKSNGPGQGGQIINSYKIRDGQEITEYILYIMNHPIYKDDITGTLEGLYFEWIVHNFLFDLGQMTNNQYLIDKAQHLDFGATIFDDDHSFYQSGSLWIGYYFAFPDQYHQDLATHLGH